MEISKIISTSMLVISVLAVSANKFNIPVAKAEETLQTLQSKQDQLVMEQNRIDEILSSLKGDASRREEYGKNLEEQVKNFCEQIDIENQKSFLIDTEITEKNLSISNAQKKIDENLENFKKRLRAIYKAGGDTAFISVILNASTLTDFFNAADVAQVIGKHDAKLLEELKSEMSKLEEEKKVIESKKQEVAKSKEILEKKRKELEKLQEENKQILEEMRQRELASRAASASQEAGTFHSEYVSEASTAPRNGRYIWPVPGYNGITSYWGDNRGHKGIDISSSGIYGAAIVAAKDGVVTVANQTDEWGSGWGYHVKIDHGSGYATQYAHCSLITVSVGQTVKAGQIIGYVGNTGDSYGAHLHFETWKDGVRYDPMVELS